MNRLIALAIVSGLIAGLAATAPEAWAKWKIKGVRGSNRATAQRALNILHPTGQSRAAAEHVLNAANKATRGLNIPPGQAKKW